MSQSISVKLVFTDGVTHELFANKGQSIVEAASAAGLTLLTDCSNGQCGTCVSQCVSGKVEMGDYDRSVLPDDERDDGAILNCVTTIVEPTVIEIPYDSSEASVEEAAPKIAKIVAVTQVAQEIYQLKIDLGEPISFLPGQYVRLKPSAMSEWRSYSMANKSGDQILDFYIRIVDGGKFSDWLIKEAQAGGEIEVSAPRGSFFLRDEDVPQLYVAGGTGLAPIISMLEKVKDSHSNQQPIKVLVGARTGAHLFGKEQLEAFKQSLPSLEIFYACEMDAPAGSYQGYATDLMTADNITRDTRIYLCGPPPMVDAARAAAIKVGKKKSEILCEKFN
jgi:benzoate/toluate 1,2-dioxygenase reductase subunit